eukprot:GHRQ01037803.1.p1 GENE.GHRQ01037803.1~~GHRQ01037803.1.p1  ORF type:complete len:127 (-),score=25.15 GHRQ01037803.1:296-676(-)
MNLCCGTQRHLCLPPSHSHTCRLAVVWLCTYQIHCSEAHEALLATSSHILAVCCVCINRSEAHEAMVAVAADIKLEEVNAVAASLLTFASDVGREAEMLELAAEPGQEGKWARPGPTRCATSLEIL